MLQLCFKDKEFGLGLLGDLLQTKEWQAIEENKLPLVQAPAVEGETAVPPIQLFKVFHAPEKPEIFANNATNAAVAVFNLNQKIYENYIKDTATLKMSIYKALSEPLQSLMIKDGAGIRNTSPKDMLKILDDKFKTLKPSQINEISKVVNEWTFDVAQRLEPQLSELKHNLRILHENDQRKPSSEVIGIVKCQLMQHPNAFHTAIVIWEQKFTTAASQTVDNFFTAMTDCDNTRCMTATNYG